MSMRQRIAAAAGLLVLGGLGVIFLGVRVTRCLGPLGQRTPIEAIRDGCLDPTLGPGPVIGVAAVVAALLLLLPASRAHATGSMIGALAGASVGISGYWLLRPTSMTGPTARGDVITIALPLDPWALIAAGIAGAGVGWLLGRWLARRRLAAAL